MNGDNIDMIDLLVTENEEDTDIVETIQIVEVEDVDAPMIETDNAFAALGEPNPALSHAVLNNRDIEDQHPISAITGLQNELDKINELKTVYSNGIGTANYYGWCDGNVDQEDRLGYFVSLCKKINTVEICTGDSIFGVVVDEAAFIGGQNDDGRDYRHGLIVSSGVVGVRCESDVSVGDYVVSNAYGIAKKATSGCGYKVVALNDIVGETYATIALNISADQIDKFGDMLHDFDSRLDASESNIVSAVNLANQAYNLAKEVEVSNNDLSCVVGDVSASIGDLSDNMNDMALQIARADTIAVQAKAIAEGAVTMAESTKLEVKESINNSMAETSALRKDFEAKVAEIDANLDATSLELQKTNENLADTSERLQSNIDKVSSDLEDTKTGLNNTRDELQSNIDSVSGELDKTKEDLQNASDKLTEDINGVSSELNSKIDGVKEELSGDIDGIVSDLDNTKQDLLSTKEEFNQSIDNTNADLEALEKEVEPLVEWTDGESTGAAGFIARANEDSTTLASIVTWQDETNKSIAGFKQEVADTYATIDSVTSLKTETSESIADVQQKVDANEANITALTTWKNDAASDVESIAGIKATANENAASIKNLVSWQSEATASIAAVTTKADANEADIASLVSWQGTTNTSISNIEQKVNKNEASITSLNTWKGETAESLSAVTQKASDNEASIKSLTSTQDETNKAVAGIEQRVGVNEASIESITTWQGTTDETMAAVQEKADQNEASINSITEWQGTTDTAIAQVEQKASENESNIGTLASWKNDAVQSITSVEQKASANESNISLLTQWKTDVEDDVDSIASIKTQSDANKSAIESLTSWKGTTNETLSSVKQQSDSNKSSIDAITLWQGETEESIAKIEQQADGNSASITSLTEWQGETNESLASIDQRVGVNESSISSLTTWQGETNTAIANVEQKASDNESAIESLTTWKGEASESIASVTQKASDNESAIEGLASWKDTASESITSIGQKADANEASIGTLTTWQGEAKTAITNIENKANANEASINTLTEWKDGASTSIANLQQTTNNHESSINTLTSWKSSATTSIANVEQKASDNESKINSLTSWKDEASESISTVEQKASANESSIESITTWQGEATKSIASIEEKANANESSIKTLTEWKDGADASISSIEQTTTKHEGSINSLTSWKSDAQTAITNVEQKAGSNESKINSLTTWQDETNIAMARIEQKADANGAYIQSTVSNMDKYSVGPYSQAYGFTLEQAAEVLGKDVFYVPTTSHEEEYKYVDANGKTQTYKRTFTPQYLYKWGTVNGQYRWITVDKNYEETSETNTSSKAVYFTTTEPAVSGNFGYWYTDGDSITGTTGTYEPYTLYKWWSYVDEAGETQHHWVAVATLNGNSSSRSVSQIRQDTNSIELSVADVKGDVAESKQWIDNNSANIQDVVTWKSNNGDSLVTFMQTAGDNFASTSQVAKIVDKDGNINAASIVTAVNNAGSSVVIDADHIQLDGIVSFVNDEIGAVKESAIYDTKVEYALSSSSTTFTAVAGSDGQWSTTAPKWKYGYYMWQKTTITKGDKSVAYTQTCIQGAKGEDGYTPVFGKDYFNGTNGENGTSIVWKGSFNAAPSNPENGWAYYNTSAKASYTYQNGSWYQMSIDGVDGQDGKDGSGVKKINTHIRNFSMQNWQKYGEVGHEENWTTGVDYDNTHINVGDTAYLVGVISDAIGAGGVPAEAVIYGTVTQNVTNHVRMISSCLITGGKNGEQGIPGINGVDAPQVINVTKQYYLSSSNITWVGGTWSTEPSNFIKGYYMWTRDVYAMSDGSIVYGDPTLDNTFTTISSWCSENDTTLIDGANIATGTVSADKIDVYDVIAFGNLATQDDIPSEAYITEITKDTITTSYIEALDIHVNAANIDGTLSADQINVGDLISFGGIATYDQIPSNREITQITKNTITTEYVEALEIHVDAARIDGTLEASQINVSDVISFGKLVTQDDIPWVPDDDYITTITENTITTTNVTAKNLKVKAANIEDTLSASQINVGEIITFGNLATQNDIPFVPDDDYITTITENTITTTNVTAKNLTVKAANIDGTLSADKIDVDSVITVGGIAKTSDVPSEDDITTITENAITTTNVTAKNLKVDAANVGGTLRMGDDGYISIDGEDEGDGLVSYVNLPGIRINNFGTFLDDGLVVTDATIGGLGIRDDSITGDYWYVGNDKFKCGDFVADSDGNITASSVSTDSFSYTGAGSLYLFSINGTDCSYENISADNISTNSLSVSWMELGYTDNYRESYCFVSFGNTSVDLYTDSGYLVGTWYADSCLADSSDVNKKNSIQDPSDQYDVVFKNLSPKTFKYNNGTSDRKHFGFIAQEVEQAVIESGLTTQDFAGFIRAKELNEETKEFDDVCYLRYGEFVALNTWQIQKLQTRVTELENQIIELQNLINGGDE